MFTNCDNCHKNEGIHSYVYSPVTPLPKPVKSIHICLCDDCDKLLDDDACSELALKLYQAGLCSHCHKNTATHHYLYADTRGAPKDFPLLTVNPDIPVGLCDDCNKLFDDQARIDVVYEVLDFRQAQDAAERLKPD